MIYFYGFKGSLVGVEFDLNRQEEVVPVCATRADGTEIDLDSDEFIELEKIMYKQDLAYAKSLYGKGY